MSSDLSGRNQLVRNVIFSWGGQFVFIAAGFVMPRLINAKLGQEVLGVWDFAWSLLAYFGFVQGGITSAVNRFVGRLWAVEDHSGINRIVSCATLCLVTAGVLVAFFTAGTVMAMPRMFADKLEGNLSEAQFVVAFLGLTLVFQTALGAFNGVITGCHRWDTKNINQCVWHLVAVGGMIVALQTGGGLCHMAVITCAAAVLGELNRTYLAFRICPGLRLSPALVDRRTIKELYLFGGKTLIPTLSELLRNSTTSFLIVAFLGPASLALFMRPRSLLRQAETLVRKMTMTLIPSVSSLQGQNNPRELSHLIIKSVQYTLYLTVPIMGVLAFFGDYVMELWMGPGYADASLVAVLSVGGGIAILSIPMLDVLAGLNAHGRAGIAQFIGAMIGTGLTYLVLGPLGLGLMWAALALLLPPVVISLIYYPRLACRAVGMPLADFFRYGIGGPLARLTPFMLGLLVARLCFPERLGIGLLVGLGLTLPYMMRVYWISVLPGRIRSWAKNRVPFAMLKKRRI